eukprot:scaffold249963_cov146-Cyclotella_meneghiniana.AAC.2
MRASILLANHSQFFLSFVKLEIGDALTIGNSGGVYEDGSDPPSYDNSNEPVEAPTPTYSGSQFAEHSQAARIYAENNHPLAAKIMNQ